MEELNPQGWVKIHRKMTKKGWYKRSAYVHLWVHLLLRANKQSEDIFWNDEIITIKPGQFLTGREKLHSETSIPETTIERALSFFEQSGKIGQQKTTKYRIITIKKWELHQKRTTDGQQTDTNKKEKKEKNIICDAPPATQADSTSPLLDKTKEDTKKGRLKFGAEAAETIKLFSRGYQNRFGHPAFIKYGAANKLVNSFFLRYQDPKIGKQMASSLMEWYFDRADKLLKDKDKNIMACFATWVVTKWQADDSWPKPDYPQASKQ